MRKFLKRKGLKTLTRNYASKAGEIDLIMVDSDRSIVFVEVKTRADEEFTPTESVITKPKMDRMTKDRLFSSQPTKLRTDHIVSISLP